MFEALFTEQYSAPRYKKTKVTILDVFLSGKSFPSVSYTEALNSTFITFILIFTVQIPFFSRSAPPDRKAQIL